MFASMHRCSVLALVLVGSLLPHGALAIDGDRRSERGESGPRAIVAAEEAALRATPPVGGELLGQSVGITADATRMITSGQPARIWLRTGASWTLEASLSASGGVAITADGTRAVVVARAGGMLTIYLRAGSSWSVDGTITLANATTVAIDRDATRLIAGRGTSGARIYVRSGSTWTMEYDVAGPRDVISLAMTRDGTRAFLGQPRENSDAGWVRELVRTGTTWAVGQTIDGVDAGERLGEAVAVSGDGLRLVIGVPDWGFTPGSGHADVYVLGTTWTREASLVPTGIVTSDRAGAAVGISADGRTLVIGAPEVGTSRGRVVTYGRTGTTWTEGSNVTPADIADGDRFGTSIAMADVDRFVASSPHDRIGTTANAGSAYVFRIGASPGTTCTADVECLSGFCTDGVCCDMRCSSACESCSAAGACLPDAVGGTCRASAGVCDPMAEVCDGVGRSCPADVRSPAGTVCRVAAGTCDVAETCDGSSAACPADVRVAAATECRAATGGCDRPELCDGTSTACPTSGASGVLSSGTSCRASTGPCDVPEVCDGLSMACPGDVLLGAGTACGSSAGTCAASGMCNGTSGACMGGTPLAAGTVCLYASPSNPCDVDDVCDGTSTTCAPRFAAAGTVCNDLLMGLCDTEDVCTGTSADCMPTFLAGTECRPSTAPCDDAEVCSGSSPICPTDGIEAAGISCRASTDPSCDPEEVCDGLSTACPAEVNTCVDVGALDGGARDAGADGGSAVDAGVVPPSAAEGCGCHAGTSAPSPLLLVALAGLFLRKRTR